MLVVDRLNDAAGDLCAAMLPAGDEESDRVDCFGGGVSTNPVSAFGDLRAAVSRTLAVIMTYRDTDLQPLMAVFYIYLD